MSPEWFSDWYFLIVTWIFGDVFHDYLKFRRKRAIAENIEINAIEAWIYKIREE